MVPRKPHPSPVSTLRVNASLQIARAVRAGLAPDAAAQQDYATLRLAELVERELAKGPRLRAEQVAALRAIVSGADAPTVLADVVAVRPAHAAA